MTRRRLHAFLAAAALGLAAVVAAPSTVLAQVANAGTPQKIGVCNLQKAFDDLKETKDLTTKFRARGQQGQADQQAKQANIQKLKSDRDQFRPGSAEYDKANQDLVKAAVDAQVTTTVAQQELLREQKTLTRNVVTKVISAVEAVAKEKGYAMVLTQVVPPEPTPDQFDQLTPQQLVSLVNSRTPLYVDPSVDLTAEVVARLDAAYTSGK